MYPPQRVTSSCRQSTTGAQPVRVVQVGDVLPGGDVAAQRVPHDAPARARSSLLTGSSNQTTPEVVEPAPDAARLAAGVAAVGVDHQRRRRRSGQFAELLDPGEVAVGRRCPRTAPILIFIAVQPAAAQLLDLLGELLGVQGGEAAGPVDRHRCRGTLPNRRGQRDVQQPGLEVPQRDVDGADAPA